MTTTTTIIKMGFDTIEINLVYLSLSRAISDNFRVIGLSLDILSYLGLSPAISGKLGPFRAISRYLGLSLAMSVYLGLSLYLWKILQIIDQPTNQHERFLQELALLKIKTLWNKVLFEKKWTVDHLCLNRKQINRPRRRKSDKAGLF